MIVEESGHEFRKKKILKYVVANPGLSKEGIVRGMKGDPSRITVLNILDELEDEKMIVMRTDKPNSQIYRIYSNENNILVTISNELEEFEIAYSKLLDKSKEKLQTKDVFLENLKKLSIHELNQDEWSYIDVARWDRFLTSKTKEQQNILITQMNKINEVKDQIRQLDVKIDKSIKGCNAKPFAFLFSKSNSVNSDIIKAFLSMDKQLIKNECLPKLNELKSELIDNNIFSHRLNSGYFSDFILVAVSVEILFLMTEIFTYCSTLVWSKIHDKQILRNLYSIIYTKIADIQFKLNNFLSFVKSLNPFFDYNPVEMILKLKKNEPLLTSHISEYMLVYKNLDLESEYIAVAKSISNFTKKIEPYGYQLKLINDVLEETILELKVRISLLNLILDNNLNKNSFDQLFKN